MQMSQLRIRVMIQQTGIDEKIIVKWIKKKVDGMEWTNLA
jgi:hypothetical protein